MCAAHTTWRGERKKMVVYLCCWPYIYEDTIIMDTTADYLMVEWLMLERGRGEDFSPTGMQYYLLSRAYCFDSILSIEEWNTMGGGMFANLKTVDDLVVLLQRRADYEDFKLLWEFLNGIAELEEMRTDRITLDGGVPLNLIYRTTMDMSNGGGGIDEEEAAMLEGVRVYKIVHHVTDTVSKEAKKKRARSESDSWRSESLSESDN